MTSLQTPLCNVLNVNIPIVQAPIGQATNPALVAAVSNAGGFGMLGFIRRDADDVRRLISETHELTNQPFGGNFILRGLDETDSRLEACLESGVSVVSFHWDEPYQYVDRVHAANALVMYTVGSAEVARRAVDAGVDIIVAQGWEAGGHVRGEVATMALLPRVVDAVSPVPVISAGSIADGRGIAAALMLGADGVWVGTRFAASEEADIAFSYKQRILQATETDTHLSNLFFTQQYNREMGSRGSPSGRSAARRRPGNRSGRGRHTVSSLFVHRSLQRCHWRPGSVVQLGRAGRRSSRSYPARRRNCELAC